MIIIREPGWTHFFTSESPIIAVQEKTGGGREWVVVHLASGRQTHLEALDAKHRAALAREIADAVTTATDGVTTTIVVHA